MSRQKEASKWLNIRLGDETPGKVLIRYTFSGEITPVREKIARKKTLEEVNRESQDQKMTDLKEKINNNAATKSTLQRKISIPGNLKPHSRKPSQNYDAPLDDKTKTNMLRKSTSEKGGARVLDGNPG
jgi:hypothetical protein